MRASAGRESTDRVICDARLGKGVSAAAFRGVSFKVDLEEVFGARRLSVSPIAYAETSVIEDMGL
jgi:prophage DNA circulation protein